MDSNLLEEYQQIVEKCNNLRPIKITNGWEVVWNHFPDVDPMTLDEDSDACIGDRMKCTKGKRRK